MFGCILRGRNTRSRWHEQSYIRRTAFYRGEKRDLLWQCPWASEEENLNKQGEASLRKNYKADSLSRAWTYKYSWVGDLLYKREHLIFCKCFYFLSNVRHQGHQLRGRIGKGWDYRLWHQKSGRINGLRKCSGRISEFYCIKI